MNARFLVILSAASLCHGECVVLGPPQFGRVEVSAFSMLGESLAPLDVDLIQLATQKSFKSQFRGAVAKKIPYGIYTLRVRAPGFRSAQRELRVAQPEVSARTQLSVSVECGGLASIGGIVAPAPGNRELWVKLVPLRGVGGAEVRAGREGSFLAAGLDDGQYLLLVLDGKAVIHAESVNAPRRNRLTVDLGLR